MKLKKPRFSLSTNILIGLVLGILCGVFFGDYCGFLQIFGDAFIKLLQITILPYITVSLILGIGGMTYDQAKTLAVKAGALLILFWGISFLMVLLVPLSFPDLESASFFSTSIIEPPKKVDFLDLYIPSNPFKSLANNTVPAVVLFSILCGVALMGIKEKGALLQALSTAAEALIRITNLVVQLTPYGVFAISAAAAGTMSIEEFGKLQVYLISFNMAALFLAFWVLPKMVTAVTPFKYKDIVGLSRDALITAFTTGNLFVVLAILTENCKSLFREYNLNREKTDSYMDVIVPISFNFPNIGKLLMLLFILFAGWFSGNNISLAQYPTFVFSGLLSFFGGVDVAMPFMLDLMRMPADLYQLYVVTGILNGRFATLLAAMNLLVFTILATCALTGTLSLNKKKITKYVIITAVLMVGVVGSFRIYFSLFVKDVYTKDMAFVEMHLMRDPLPAKVSQTLLPPLLPHVPGKSRLHEIRQRGFLRVGYFKDALPHAFRNTQGQLVGLDVEMAHTLAKDLEVSLEFILLDRAKMEEQLNTGYCDIIMTGVAITALRLQKMSFSVPYMDSTMAFIVRDHLRDTFKSWDAIEKLDSLKLGIPNAPYYVSKMRDHLPKAKIVLLNSPREFFKTKAKDLDCFVFSAEAGSAWTLLYPEYTVVVPQPNIIAVPQAFPMPKGDRDFVDFVNAWIDLKRKDGTIKKLYDHWILGKGAIKKEPRWSIIRNVLHWVD
jgi:Na+/H+-dicarboxylate symporter/ABC-type amino acid transport substrate-binding protein